MAPSQRVIDAAYASVGTGVLLMSVAVWSIMNEISKKCGKNEKHSKNVDWMFFVSIGFGTMTLLWELFGGGSVHKYIWTAAAVALSLSIVTGASVGIDSYNKCDKVKKAEVCAKDKNYLITMLAITVVLIAILLIIKGFF